MISHVYCGGAIFSMDSRAAKPKSLSIENRAATVPESFNSRANASQYSTRCFQHEYMRGAYGHGSLPPEIVVDWRRRASVSKKYPGK